MGLIRDVCETRLNERVRSWSEEVVGELAVMFAWVVELRAPEEAGHQARANRSAPDQPSICSFASRRINTTQQLQLCS